MKDKIMTKVSGWIVRWIWTNSNITNDDIGLHNYTSPASEQYLSWELSDDPGEEINVMDTAVMKHPARGPEYTPMDTNSLKGNGRQTELVHMNEYFFF